MTSDAGVGPPVKRGGAAAVKWRRFISDHDAVAQRALVEPVRPGVHDHQRLRKYDVGVPPLWPSSRAGFGRQTPLGITAFQTMTHPPAIVPVGRYDHPHPGGCVVARRVRRRPGAGLRGRGHRGGRRRGQTLAEQPSRGEVLAVLDAVFA